MKNKSELPLLTSPHLLQLGYVMLKLGINPVRIYITFIYVFQFYVSFPSQKNKIK